MIRGQCQSRLLAVNTYQSTALLRSPLNNAIVVVPLY